MVGKFSQYKKITATPNDSAFFSFSNPLNVVPKLIYISCADDSDAKTNVGLMRDSIADFDFRFGAVSYHNANDVFIVNAINRRDDFAGNQTFGMYNGDIRINRLTNTIVWSTTTEYTIEIYA